MRRRQFLASASLGALSAGGGCVVASRFTADDDPSHPLADAVTAVRIDNQSRTDHDVERNAWEALTFWEANTPELVGFEFRFELVESEPDLVISYADTPAGCQNVEGDSELVMGCAPLIRAGESAPEPIPVTVVAGNRPYGEVRITTQHEIGHTLGLGHDDEPRQIMSDRPEDRVPLYHTRVSIWESVVGAQTTSTDAISQFKDGVAAWEQHDYSEAHDAFGGAHRQFQAARTLIGRCQDDADAFAQDDRMETVDLPGLRDRLNRIDTRLDHAVSFAGSMSKATRAAGNGNQRRANSHLRDANTHIRAFNEIEPPPVREIAVALGLIRGTQRNGTVVDIEDEAFGYGQQSLPRR